MPRPPKTPDHFPFRHREPPAWWPENEPWPPRHRRNAFFRRMGCLFGVFNLLGPLVFLVLAGLALRALGIVQFDTDSVPWLVPLLGGFLLVLMLLGVFAMRGMRRLANPLDEMLSASGRVAEGDYSVRVEERGPPEIRSLAHSFNSMAARLEASDRQRRSMLADVSHELRTPITVIQGSVEGMLDNLYPADEENLRSILEETQILSRLVDDLRTLALAESGALHLKCEPVNLEAQVAQALASFASTAEAAGVELELKVLGGAVPEVEADPFRLREILTNLIANAIRYSPRGGGVRVQVSGTSVSIEDDGPGISPEELPHIFERFYRSSDSGGMGLGLSIARDLVEAHGGSIAAESVAGQGTRITFSLPDDAGARKPPSFIDTP